MLRFVTHVEQVVSVEFVHEAQEGWQDSQTFNVFSKKFELQSQIWVTADFVLFETQVTQLVLLLLDTHVSHELWHYEQIFEFDASSKYLLMHSQRELVEFFNRLVSQLVQPVILEFVHDAQE